ncbi:MAG: UDP-glucose dehydrogenase family protein [Nitrospirota bacterium]
MNICVIGTGYVGLVTGACFAEFGVRVVCVDNDESKIEGLKKFILPIYEPGLEELVKKNVREKRLSFTTDLGKSVEDSLCIFIAVGTPPNEDGSTDLSYIETVAENIARHINGYKVIVTKSTVPVGTGDKIREIIGRSQKERNGFDIVSNPEFLREGSAIEDFMHPNRVIIGASSQQAIAIMKDLYSPLYLIETPFVITDIPSAEMIKYASNAFLATKISFINEVANLCERVRADVHVVARGMGLDKRIGSKFLHPGPGFGGSCFPKDILSLSQIAKKNGYDMEVLNSVIKINNRQKILMIDKIKKMMGGDINGKVIGILGLSFKPNTDDMRESPAITVINGLKKEGAIIKTFDPAAMDIAKAILTEITYCNDPYEAADDADALVMLTEWNQFRNLDLNKIKEGLKKPVIIDLRNIYDPKKMKELGFSYIGIGRV